MSININRISGRALKFFATIAVIVSFTILYKEDTYAASFTHVHTDECYHSETRTCSDHYFKTQSVPNTYHCSTCQEMRTFSQTIYWECCRNGIISPKDVAYKQTCTVCGSTRRYEDPGNPTPHSYTSRELICGLDESTPVANVSLAAVSSAPTNGSVTLKIDVAGAGQGFALAAAPYNFGAGNTSDPSFTVTENGTYNASVTDANGRTVTVSFVVNSIDKATPVIDGISKDTEAWSESGVTISVDAHDEGLGLAEDAFSFNGGAFGAANSFRVTSNGTVSVRVKDAAGNISESSITIANVGRDPKVVEAERREAERVAAEKAAAEKAAAEKAAAEKAAQEKEAADKAAKEKAEKDKATKEKASKAKASTETSNATAKDTAKTGSKTASKNTQKEESSEDIKSVFGEFKDTVTGGSAMGSAFGKLIVVKDLTAPEEEIAVADYCEDVIESVNDFADEACENFSDESLGDENGAGILKASMGDMTVPAGILLLLAGAFFISRFSYVYVMQGGKKRLICRCRVVKGQNGLTAVVPGEKLTAHGKYLLYISPWKKGLNKKLPVSVMLEGEDAKIPTDEGIAFKY